MAFKIGAVQFQNAPYRDSTYDYYNSHFHDKIYVGIFKGVEDTHPEWNYKNNNLKSSSISCFGFDKSIKKWLKENDFDAISVAGYSSLTSIYAIAYALFHRLPIILQADTVESRRWTRLKKFIYKLVSSIWLPGASSKRYFLSCGVSEEKLFSGSYTYDYSMIKDRIKLIDKKYYRKYYGIEKNEYVFLFVGKLIPSRKIDNLIEVINKIKFYDIKFIIIGDGDDEGKIDKITNKEKLVYIPSVTLQELYIYYAIADAYVHPGKEPYSCAVMQAVASGLPIVITDEVGAVNDFSDSLKNFIKVPYNNIDMLYEAILYIYNNREIYCSNAIVAQTFICEDRSIEFAANQLKEAIQYAINRIWNK